MERAQRNARLNDENTAENPKSTNEQPINEANVETGKAVAQQDDEIV